MISLTKMHQNAPKINQPHIIETAKNEQISRKLTHTTTQRD